MTDEPMDPDGRPARERLLEQDGIGPDSGRDRWTELSRILEHERAVERRLRTVAVWAWAVTFGTVPLAGVVGLVIRGTPPVGVELLRGVLVVLALVGGLSLMAAIVASVGWIFRSRAPTLQAVEARLARLEELLLARPGTAKGSDG